MFGQRIKELRLEKGLTQSEFAAKINTTQTNVSKYELEALDLKTETILNICNTFNISADYLLGREDDYGIISAGQTTILTKDEEELLSVYRKMDANTKQQTLGFFRAAFSSNF